MDIEEKFSEHISMFNTAPFLFIGSGMSIRYLGLENFKDLLIKFSEYCGQDSFEYYYTESDGNLPKVAGLMANDFHKVWFKSDKFNDRTRHCKEHLIKKDSPLKIEISEYMKVKSNDVIQSEEVNREIELMKNITIDGIITTNWDLLIENIFPEFQVFTGQQELLFSEAQSIAEIYKIHGCCTKPNSLVLTDQDYELFNKRNPYLAAKLLTIFLEHPIIFMGYSIEDPNIKEILTNVGLCLTNENADKLKDRLIFVEWTNRESEDQITPREFVISDNETSIIIPLTVVRLNDFSLIYKSLSEIKRKVPAKLLREIKDHIYDLVRTNDPKDRLYVIGIEDETDMSDIDVVLGVGIINYISEKGYEGITRQDLFKDLIFENGDYDPRKILRIWPKLIAGNVTYVPIFKYLREANYLSSDGKLRQDADLDPRIVHHIGNVNNNHFRHHIKSPKKIAEIQENNGIDDLIENYGLTHTIRYIPLLKEEDISVERLKKLLENNFGYCGDTHFRKIACLYDWLRFGSNE